MTYRVQQDFALKKIPELEGTEGGFFNLLPCLKVPIHEYMILTYDNNRAKHSDASASCLYED